MLFVDGSSDSFTPRQPVIDVVGLGPNRHHFVERQSPNGQAFQFRYRTLGCVVDLNVEYLCIFSYGIAAFGVHPCFFDTILVTAKSRQRDRQIQSAAIACRLLRAIEHKWVSMQASIQKCGVHRVLRICQTFRLAALSSGLHARPRYNSRMPRKLGPYSSPTVQARRTTRKRSTFAGTGPAPHSAKNRTRTAALICAYRRSCECARLPSLRLSALTRLKRALSD